MDLVGLVQSDMHIDILIALQFGSIWAYINRLLCIMSCDDSVIKRKQTWEEIKGIRLRATSFIPSRCNKKMTNDPKACVSIDRLSCKPVDKSEGSKHIWNHDLSKTMSVHNNSMTLIMKLEESNQQCSSRNSKIQLPMNKHASYNQSILFS